ncbi:MAG: hypothetical protein IT169_15890 [Bryobacterales bacterium]|nr:hypothetical protein [Bryobacterales bacterium]
MARIRRVVAVGCPRHVTQRGNFRRDLFFDDEDRQTHLALLAGHAADRHLRLLGYCLMSNPIHLIAVPARAGSPSLPTRDAPRDESRGLNIRLHRCGPSWENRFFSCPLDPAHAACAMRHVEFNPVRAGMAASVPDYPWSSARVLAGLVPAPPWRRGGGLRQSGVRGVPAMLSRRLRSLTVNCGLHGSLILISVADAASL